MKLIDNWRLAWRLNTVQAAAALAAVSMLQAEVLPMVQFAVPPRAWPYVTAAFGIAIVLLRLRAQPDRPQRAPRRDRAGDARSVDRAAAIARRGVHR